MKQKGLVITLFTLAIAALLALLLLRAGGGKEAQSGDCAVHVLETVSAGEESSYRIGATLPAADFSSIGEPLADAIAREWEAYDSMTEFDRSVSSKRWGSVSIQADTWGECEEAIGLSVWNPLESPDWLEKTGYFGMESADPHTPVKHIQILANAGQADNRKVTGISVTAGYNVDGIRITLGASLSASEGAYTTGSIYNGYATYEEKSATTGTGIPVVIVITNGTNSKGYYHANYYDPTVYWVKDNVFYTLRVLGAEADRDKVQGILDRILQEI